jgi:hypothetical protein
VRANRLPVPPLPGAFAVDASSGFLSPQLVVEVAVSHESLRTLRVADLNRYFYAGTGTRAWVGIKLLKNNPVVNPTGVHRWWVGWAKRRMINGAFVDEGELQAESMPVVDTYNVELSLPTNLIFHIDVGTLLWPCAVPPNYPLTFDINIEEIRQLILEYV